MLILFKFGQLQLYLFFTNLFVIFRAILKISRITSLTSLFIFVFYFPIAGSIFYTLREAKDGTSAGCSVKILIELFEYLLLW